jgi:hypothetical protein
MPKPVTVDRRRSPCYSPTIAPTHAPEQRLRRMVRETELSAGRSHPAPVRRHGKGVKNPIPPCRALPAVRRQSGQKARQARDLGIPAIILFGCRTKRTRWEPRPTPRTASSRRRCEVKNRVPDLAVITDVCLCAYTDHGHCGTVDGHTDGQRRFPRSAGPHGPVPRQGRCRHGGPVGHDGRPGGRNPRPAGRQ